jgi:hypothetical protein
MEPGRIGALGVDGMAAVRGWLDAIAGTEPLEGIATECATADCGLAVLLGMIAVPGIFFGSGGSGVGAGPALGCGEPPCPACAAATAAPPAASYAPRCDITLLTASGETCPPGSAGCDTGGGPYGSRVVPGIAVCANGFTLTGAAVPYAGSRTLPGALPGALCGAFGIEAAELGARGSTVGAPHAAQNFFFPMSSAPHLAQWVITTFHVGAGGEKAQARA